MIHFNIIGNRLKRSRCDNNLSLLDLSKLLLENGLELSEEMINDVENGEKYLDIFGIKLISGALHVNFEEIISEKLDEIDLDNKFRTKKDLSEGALIELGEILNFTTGLIAQKRICDTDIKEKLINTKLNHFIYTNKFLYSKHLQSINFCRCFLIIVIKNI